MKTVLEQIGKLLEDHKGDNQTKLAYARRNIIYKAYEGEKTDVLKLEINGLRELSENAKQLLLKKIERVANDLRLDI